MLSTILIVILILGALLLALSALAVVFAFHQGWFTLPHPAPDRERVKAPHRPA